MRTKQVECIVYKRNKDIKYLLLKRILKKGGFWQPPCGGVEGDETLLKASFREIEEETGIKKDKILSIKKDVHRFTMHNDYLSGQPMQTITEYVSGFEVDLSVTVTLENNTYKEHEEYRWVGFDEAMKLLKWEDNKKALTKLHDLLKEDCLP